MLRRLARAREGTALTEFAIVLPVLLMLFLSGFAVSDMILCYRKVTITTRTLADLISRNVSPSGTVASSTLTTYLNSSGLVLTPFATSKATLQITELRVCDATHAYVVWSQAQTGSTSVTPSYTAGTVVSITSNLITSPMVPTSADGSDVCNNTTAGTNKTVVGTAGGYLFLAQVSYAYKPIAGLGSLATTTMTDQTYMIPRLV